jgi:hypothetical protein
MPLPKIEHPIHEVYLKSLDRKVKFRPFLVKEEKLLLISKESEEIETVKNAIKQVLRNCCLEDVDIDSLPLFDIEMFFIHLRIKSVGEKVNMAFTCNNIIEEVPCGEVTEYSMDLNKIGYEIPEGHKNVIPLSKDVGIKLKYPTINLDIQQSDDAYTVALKVISDNIELIYDGDSVYYRKDIGDDEMENFLNDLSMDQIEEIRNFFVTLPKVVLNDKMVCKKCKFEHDVNVGDLYGFFI